MPSPSNIWGEPTYQQPLKGFTEPRPTRQLSTHNSS